MTTLLDYEIKSTIDGTDKVRRFLTMCFFQKEPLFMALWHYDYDIYGILVLIYIEQLQKYLSSL